MKEAEGVVKTQLEWHRAEGSEVGVARTAGEALRKASQER